MIDKDRYIKAYSLVFDVSEDKVRDFLKTRHISSLIDNADNLLVGSKQKKKYEAFKSLYMMSEAISKDIEQIDSPKRFIAYARATMNNIFDREVFCMLSLNAGLQPISAKVISEGSISSANIDFRNIFKYALQDNASSVIFFHNHPTGTLKPSLADIKTTRELFQIGRKLDVDVIDHLIISGYEKDKYFSMRQDISTARNIWELREEKKEFVLKKDKEKDLEF